MNTLIEMLTGMDKLTDQVIATDFLISAKNGVINYSMALTETTSPRVREVLKKQLTQAISTHATIVNYMMKKGYYNAYNLQEQFKVDMEVAETSLTLADKLK
jgi:similar to spore coat protein